MARGAIEKRSFQSTVLFRPKTRVAEILASIIMNRLVVEASCMAMPAISSTGTYVDPPPCPTIENGTASTITAKQAMTKTVTEILFPPCGQVYIMLTTC
jgi:hypothetical protein